MPHLKGASTSCSLNCKSSWLWKNVCPLSGCWPRHVHQFRYLLAAPCCQPENALLYSDVIISGEWRPVERALTPLLLRGIQRSFPAALSQTRARAHEKNIGPSFSLASWESIVVLYYRCPASRLQWSFFFFFLHVGGVRSFFSPARGWKVVPATGEHGFQRWEKNKRENNICRRYSGSSGSSLPNRGENPSKIWPLLPEIEATNNGFHHRLDVHLHTPTRNNYQVRKSRDI